ncbi:MAG TPA: nucleoside 2-deoxyribosyltransferase domain-containing protein, partial [Bacteroidia bacterium]|nr:nucleoside 2-deoxyribosyltransferase domain-containing protein [Bacteroidia bacterium]
MERAELIVMYLDPATKSPVSLLELGLHANSGKLVVCCPDGFWRKGNVDITCLYHGVQQVTDLSELEAEIRKRLLS